MPMVLNVSVIIEVLIRLSSPELELRLGSTLTSSSHGLMF